MDKENEYGTLEMQRYLLPILVDIDKFCRANDIKYSLSDGTLLGAIRHSGFIPWDDDIDITFDRANFEKFLDLAKDLPDEYEIVHDIWIRRISRKDNPRKSVFPPEGCIDLFVFDKVPKKVIVEKIQVLFLRLLQGMIKKTVIYEGFSIQKKLLLFGSHMLGKLFPQRLKQRWYNSVSQWGNKNPSQKIARLNGSYKGIGNARYPATIINDYEETEFEGHKFMIMKGWDIFLSVMYGDYMKLPEEYARKSTHDHIGEKT